jgi:hypothetical protein
MFWVSVINLLALIILKVFSHRIKCSKFLARQKQGWSPWVKVVSCRDMEWLSFLGFTFYLKMCDKFYEPFKSISLVMANVCNLASNQHCMLLQQKNIRIRFYNITCWLRLGRSFISLMTYCRWLWVDRTSHASPKLPDPRNFTFSYRFLFISAHFTLKFTFSKIKLDMKLDFAFPCQVVIAADCFVVGYGNFFENLGTLFKILVLFKLKKYPDFCWFLKVHLHLRISRAISY